MDKQELYLQTIFCCMACDGNIAPEEIAMVRNMTSENTLFKGVDVESKLNTYIQEINLKGSIFLKKYLDGLTTISLSDTEQLTIIDLAIKTIECDQRIEYSEVKFFKKIRSRLTLSDEEILKKHPDKEDFLLPDINVLEEPEWENITFDNITLNES